MFKGHAVCSEKSFGKMELGKETDTQGAGHALSLIEQHTAYEDDIAVRV